MRHKVPQLWGALKLKTPQYLRPRCCAETHKGMPCRAQALQNGRCKNHGGLSTGPRTPEGKARQSAAANATAAPRKLLDLPVIRPQARCYTKRT
jgi:hypothetical protein